MNVLLVEDNPTDVRLTREAFEEVDARMKLHVVRDGEEALEFVTGSGAYSERIPPDIILLDLNLPKKDGFEVLRDLKEHPDYKKIPVIVLTTSGSHTDILKTYNLHANSYIQKPVELEAFMGAVQSLRLYWFATVTLPPI
ncbi:two-component system response regulator [Leptospira perolatii]|uniref:Two-component system response regulator n=1 Tax=Leptospira perolatii TaxID=2023191 RepID=A0A2M9ZRB9_9LEPT|nr:two-component system response regulator [Leptospira perolatii]PJZ74483.1 two-component system response regulator [Leptospira perolatii]